MEQARAEVEVWAEVLWWEEVEARQGKWCTES